MTYLFFPIFLGWLAFLDSLLDFILLYVPLYIVQRVEPLPHPINPALYSFRQLLPKQSQIQKVLSSLTTLQMKGWWESNINVWFPFMYSQKWNCAVCILIISKTEL
jgi:hypothetical protein